MSPCQDYLTILLSLFRSVSELFPWRRPLDSNIVVSKYHLLASGPYIKYPSFSNLYANHVGPLYDPKP